LTVDDKVADEEWTVAGFDLGILETIENCDPSNPRSLHKSLRSNANREQNTTGDEAEAARLKK